MKKYITSGPGYKLFGTLMIFLKFENNQDEKIELHMQSGQPLSLCMACWFFVAAYTSLASWLGYSQTVYTQIKCHRMRPLARHHVMLKWRFGISSHAINIQ